MFKVIITTDFEASHYVRMPCGKIEKPHNHTWKLEVAVSADKLDENGFAVEFGALKKTVSAVTARFESQCLNDFDDFEANFPTAESVCKYIYDNIKKQLPLKADMDYTLLEEAQGCCVKYLGA